MKLRLIEQACRCCTVLRGGRLKVQARLYCHHFGVQSVFAAVIRRLQVFVFATDASRNSD